MTYLLNFSILGFSLFSFVYMDDNTLGILFLLLFIVLMIIYWSEGRHNRRTNQSLQMVSLSILTLITSSYFIGEDSILVLDKIVYSREMKSEDREKIVSVIKRKIDAIKSAKGKRFYFKRIKDRDVAEYVAQQIYDLEQKNMKEKLKEINDSMSKLRYGLSHSEEEVLKNR